MNRSPAERAAAYSQYGRRAAAAQRAKLERKVDPDGTLDPAERERRISEIRSERAKRGAETLRRSGKKKPRPAQAPVTVTEAGPDQPPPRRRKPSPAPPDPEIWERPDIREALAEHDFATVYRELIRAGTSQRVIAVLTGQAQSGVSEVLHAHRRVVAYELVERIAVGLGIPRGLVGLGWSAQADPAAYAGPVTIATPEGVLRMLRRHLLALAGLSVFGAAVPGLGELQQDLPLPPMPGEVPGRIGMPDVELIRDWTTQVRTLARVHGGEGRASATLAAWADRWLDADANDQVRAELLGTLSETHVIAAWCCHDEGAVARSHWHFARAVELATDADDAYRAAYALRHAAMMMIERDQPNDGLKAVQLATVRLGTTAPDDQRVQELQHWCHAVRALALSRLDDGRKATRDQAQSALAQARDAWAPARNHARADMDLVTSLTWLHLGETARAEAAAAKSVMAFGADRREGVVADLTLARLHVATGEARGLTLARDAITAVGQTRSAVARQVWLPHLAEALEARPGTEAAELARQARQVAA
ncbi:MAG TPA: hypothetical protein VHH34_01575 [Pseudonocardiaceae bacterium]|nr:hypothetical protein [Pseudonocardiaceae bacterium]